MKKVFLVLALLLVALPGWASKVPAEASMLVTGSITVNPDGSVNSFQLDWKDELPQPVTALLEKNVSRWRFRPVEMDGVPVTAQARMSIRVGAREAASPGTFTLSLQGAAFGNDVIGSKADEAGCDADDCHLKMMAHQRKPAYPSLMVENGVQGTVYLIQEISRDGRVLRQEVRQVNLRIRADKAVEKAWRDTLARATLQVANDWTYRYPAAGLDSRRDRMIVIVPVVFGFVGPAGMKHDKSDRHWKWDVFVPGPKQDIPWAYSKHEAITDTDAIPNVALFNAESAFKLLTPITEANPVAPVDPKPGRG